MRAASGGHRLWPPGLQANRVPPGGVPRRMRSILLELLRNSVGHDGINHCSIPNLDLIVQRTGLTHDAFQRGPRSCSRNTERTRARMTRRADGQIKNQAIFAHLKRAKKHYNPNVIAKSFGLCYLHSDRDRNRICPIYIRVSIAVCEAIAEQTEKSSSELFSYVSAVRTESAC